MRISDWSSDVCSSDLCRQGDGRGGRGDRAGWKPRSRSYSYARHPCRPGDSRPVLPQADRVSHHAGSRKGRCLMPWTREPMAAQAARELQAGLYVNLGIGIPTLVAHFVPIDIEDVLQSEKEMLDTRPFPYNDEGD